MLGKKKKLKKTFDDRLRTLLLDTKEDWEKARDIEKYLNDYDQEIVSQRKIAEAKHFYLFKEAKARQLGKD